MSTRKPEKGKTPAKKAPQARPPTAAPKGSAGSSKPTAAKSAGTKPASAAKSAPPTKAAKPAAKAAAPLKSVPAPKSAPAPKAAKPARPTAPTATPSAPANHSFKTPERPAAPALKEGDLKRLEEILLTERQRLLRELGHLENTVLKRSLRETSGELSGYSFHMADVGTDAMEREKAFHFASSEGRALLDVDDALRRLYGGNYGSCESCGNPIGRERLEVVPHARLCVACKEKEERSQIGRS
jgi:RNA polymerase-binding transcription factor